ncbi:MAG: DNA topoisomerase IV subunit A [Bacilli bacterium]|nr:DNA topoisomerase IV subunit A [Mycoplasmatota bacterium]MDY4237103.1 DNA topoisomerase IV subunit A [Bacilli bacterium]
MKKNNTTEQILEKIYNYSLEEIMGERFGRYSKYIIQDRAIPDVRDGLKPVQRRILYAMYIGHNTYDKPYRKSAKTVGDVIGSFHPHGDTSIYDAMVRLSQDWKIKNPMIDMHGNNGSIDGDSPAAYRYTEARLSKISSELLKDIEKNTVKFAPNFDDTVMEPTVLPAKFPNLLVNGTTGISAGYATNIPPHNLGEIIDACIKRIDSPNCRVETILDIVKGPDFPTGGICLDKQGIINAFTTGRGKVVVRSKIHEEESKGKISLVVTEIPYEVLKVNIVKKIDEIRIDKKLDGLLEVRDESDKEGLRIVIDIKKEANKDLILNYLYKNTELQTSYNYNMIAIVNRCPKLLSLIDIIDAYILHLKEVLTNRTKFDLDHAKLRFHIVEGLIKAISILDEVIRVIRASKNKSDAKENLVKEFDFTIEQAEAIVTLQLYRLTNTDITLLEDELKDLNLKIETYNKILTEEEALKYIMKKELKAIKDEYDVPRKTVIEDHLEEIKINEEDMITKEDVVVLITKDGYVKRTSKRSYNSSNDEPLLKENDYVLGLYELNTIDTVLIFTNLGNYLYLPVHEIPDIKWKVLGKHISNIIKLEENEKIVSIIPVTDFNINKEVVIASKLGMIKKTPLKEFKVSRYSKAISCMKLKDNDEVIDAKLNNFNDIMISTSSCFSLWFDESEIPSSGIKSSGVKSMTLKNDEVVSMNIFDKTLEYVTIFTDNKTAKRVKLEDFEKSTRARRGLLILREVKTNPYNIKNVFVTNTKAIFGLRFNDRIEKIKNTDLPILDRYKTGTTISKEKYLDVFEMQNLTTKEKIEEDKEEVVRTVIKEPTQISLLEIDDELKKVDDMLNL